MDSKINNPLSNASPQILSEWHPTKNDSLTPGDVAFGSAKQVWWQCAHGHEWEMRVFARTKQHQKCPFCSGKRVLAGFNDLATINPGLASQWHPTKNIPFKVTEVSAGSTKKAWWIDEHDHEWEAVIQSRTKGNGCPYCANRLVLTGFNDLASAAEHQRIIEEWHPENTLSPQEVMVNANSRVKWRCSVNPSHEWTAIIANRTKRGSGCPECFRSPQKGKTASKSSVFDSPLIAEWDNCNALNPKEITVGSGQRVKWRCVKNSQHIWDAPISNRIRGAGCPYCAGYRVLAGDNDLASHPEFSHLVSQWHPDNELTPEEVTIGTAKQIKWQCEFGHVWRAGIYSRTAQKQGCPICAGRSGINNQKVSDIPDILTQWHPSNTEDPRDIPLNSARRFMWQCHVDSRHEWKASASSRAKAKSCPLCTGRIVKPGINDLASLQEFQHLVRQWHADNKIAPNEVSVSSNKRIMWQCEENTAHTWTAPIYARTREATPSNCPSCASAQRTSKGEDEVYDALISLGLAVQRSVWGVISKSELDLYLPEQKFAVEFNGLYWHSDAIRPDPQYHLNKVLACQTAGLRLFQVWEDDWRDRRDVVIRGLAHRLGVTDRLPALFPDTPAYFFEKVGARKTSVVKIAHKQAAAFLEEHHIQGKASGSHYFGLEDAQNRLRAVLVLKSTGRKGEVSIERYASAGVVSGGFTKLLKHAEMVVKPQKWVTFADLSISDGKLYENTGFIKDKVLRPDYSYMVGGQRVHKFNYRLKRFRDDPVLLFDADMSESELARLNGLHRIWDSGKIRYVKTVT